MRRSASSAKLSKGMMSAIEQGDTTQILNILKKANTSKRKKKILSLSDSAGQLPIHLAASLGQLECVKLLIEEDSLCINACDESKWTPFLCASANSHFEVCSLLLKISCDVTAQNKSGTSALHHLARKIPATEKEEVYVSVLEQIFALNTSPDIKNRLNETPLHQASMRGNLIAVKTLLENNANVNLCTV